MKHDIYSLGICLLEIGLWTSLVNYATGMDGEDLILPGLLEVASVPQMRNEKKRAFELMRVLIQVAETKLPTSMGKRYTALVVWCLTCLETSGGFADLILVSDEDDDGVALGAQYIQKVRHLFEQSHWSFEVSLTGPGVE